MEHRWSTRMSHQCNVVVDCPYYGRVSARVRDIGMGGLFAETGDFALPLNAPVHVALNLRHENDRQDFRLPAMIVRRLPGGAGIMFLESDPRILRTLRGALYGSTPPRPADERHRPESPTLSQADTHFVQLQANR